MNRVNWTPQVYTEDCYLDIPLHRLRSIRRVALIGAGDVGVMMCVGLMLYGRDMLDEIMIYAPEEASRLRLDHELHQIRSVSVTFPSVRLIEPTELAQADMVFFVASRSVPDVGEKIEDVRLYQFRSNWGILKGYVRQLEQQGYEGLYGIVSDPVDFLGTKCIRTLGLDPLRVIGFGQGVMAARARYYGGEDVHMFGPHGRGLYVANHPIKYDPVASEQLTEKTLQENLLIRSFGFKPFIAPALSSAAISFIDLISGRDHYASYFLGSMLWGERYRVTEQGLLLKKLEHAGLRDKIASVYKELVQLYEQSDPQ